MPKVNGVGGDLTKQIDWDVGRPIAYVGEQQKWI